MNTPFLTDREDGDDMRVAQLRRGAGLDLEPEDADRLERRGRGQHFEGDTAAERALLRLIDDSHAPRPIARLT